MPPQRESKAPAKPLSRIIEEVGVYPPEAYEFIQDGLAFTVDKFRGDAELPEGRKHVSGQQLSEGLREFALARWGMMAGIVLRRWNITSTMDFGRIVFSLVDGGHMSATEDDNVEDFRNVFDFKAAFDASYRIGAHR
jgi:uncharacterized repeat protein (TIGR04138 family)